MRIARKLTLLAMLALAVTGLAAPSAFAQQTEPITHNQTPLLIANQEVHGGPDATCPAVTPSPPPANPPTTAAGGCRIHVSGSNIELYAHLSAGGPEVLVSTCDVEFDARLDAAGEGFITHQEFTQGGQGTCTRRPCGQTAPGGEGRIWPIFLRETEPAPTERGTALFCTWGLSDMTNSHCEVVLPAAETTPHNYRFTAIDVVGHGATFPRCELGSVTTPAVLETEAALQTSGEGLAEQRVEIRHN